MRNEVEKWVAKMERKEGLGFRRLREREVFCGGDELILQAVV